LKPGVGLISKHNQLQWAALLAIAVVLPTVSLLWFMSRVVANERLVVQQKLATVYQGKLADAGTKATASFTAWLASFDPIDPAGNPYGLFRPLVLEDGSRGMVLWNLDGELVYPRSGSLAGNTGNVDAPLAEAWQLELVEADYAQAAQLYGRLATELEPRLAGAALAGSIRCLAKLGRLDEAIEACKKAEAGQSASLVETSGPRLLLLSLLQKANGSGAYDETIRQIIQELVGDLYQPSATGVLPTDQHLFIAKKLLMYAENAGLDSVDPELEKLKQLVAAEESSLAAAEIFTTPTGRFDVIFKTDLGNGSGYGLRHRSASSEVLILLSEHGVASLFEGYQSEFSGEKPLFRILDADGRILLGDSQMKGQAIASAPLPEIFPGGRIDLFFEGGDIFEKVARRQIAVYIWIGVLVILLILVAGAVAIQAVGKQIRLHKMKNDFIATVSHELKTPLASMRMLIDTLLAGRIHNEEQARKYLRLTAKENERLSRMIDNFLTFSRMDRNKATFTIAATNPAAIAAEAGEAVGTKFEANHCRFTVRIEDGLPDIPADHDAIVTVLINLLDNACKYTTEDKQIELAVFSEQGGICFSVADNGIGLTRRQARKIFESFYQVDNTLARTVEGCGLGLGIVSFIVNAHKGKVDVESRIGQGSTFTVRLPASRRNGV
jgi:signal transduction histidine kinase